MNTTVLYSILCFHKIFVYHIFLLQKLTWSLLAACEGGETETARLLIDKGADVNQCDEVC